jgi:HEPN domain-containing protein
MPPEEQRSVDDPREWLRIAREDMAFAEARITGVGFGLRCFHAQQAAEKAIKAVLLAEGVPFPFVHDLGRLLDTARKAGVPIPADVADADLLTDYATIARYPGNGAVGEHEHARAVATAAAVLAWAAQRIVP